jgi:N-acetylmuramoyl-L-alanine amidase
VKRGETLSEIAEQYGVSQAKLRQWNGLGRAGHIRAGQRLKVGTTAAAESPSRRAATRTHVVRRGDTLSGLAQRYGVSVASIRQANNLRGTAIKAGTKLKIPA